jgi:hypothetical protein
MKVNLNADAIAFKPSGAAVERERAAVKLLQRAWRRNRTYLREQTFSNLIATLSEPALCGQLAKVSRGSDIVPVVKPESLENRRIDAAIEAIRTFKHESHEPWSNVADFSDLCMCAGSFKAVAKELVDWELNDLGRALILRDTLDIGGSLAPYQLKRVEMFESAVSHKSIKNDRHALQRAAWFFREIGSFDIAMVPA